MLSFLLYPSISLDPTSTLTCSTRVVSHQCATVVSSLALKICPDLTLLHAMPNLSNVNPVHFSGMLHLPFLRLPL